MRTNQQQASFRPAHRVSFKSKKRSTLFKLGPCRGGTSRTMTTIKVYGDSRLNFIAPYVHKANFTTANIEIKPRGGATIRSTASEIWGHTRKHRHDVIFFLSGVNDITAWDDVSQRYKLVYQTPEDMFTGIIGAIQQFETAYHSRFPRATIIFGQITGLDLSVYAYIQDHNPAHQTIVNQGSQLINREITNINERNWVPTLWTAKHVHRPRGGGRTTNYYRQLSDGLHPTANLLQLWASDIVSTAYLCT